MNKSKKNSIIICNVQLKQINILSSFFFAKLLMQFCYELMNFNFICKSLFFEEKKMQIIILVHTNIVCIFVE